MVNRSQMEKKLHDLREEVDRSLCALTKERTAKFT